MLENIILNLPYFFGVVGVVLIILALVNTIFGNYKKEGGFNFLQPGIGFIILAVAFYFADPFIITFLNTLKS
jgi:hypothetical protein